MTEVTREACDRFATDVLTLDEPERLQRLLRMTEQALARQEPLRPILIGLSLRDRDHYELAEYVFQLAARVPGARHMALFELSVALGLQGRPDEAVAVLRRHEAEQPLNPYQLRYFAVHLSRVGQLAEASRRLEQACQGEPEAERECIALEQFSAYHHRFPAAEAIRRCQALQDTYPFRDVRGVVADITSALQQRQGYSLIRLNDGEGSVLHLSVADEAEYHELYRRNRGEFHRIWFGHEGRVFDPDFLAAVKEFNDCIANASCVGADMTEHLRVRYRQGDVRNIPCLFNIVRKLEQIRDNNPQRAQAITITDPVIHQFLLFDGELERLLQSQDRIGLVSCHSALPDALKNKFGLSDVIFHKTPGEAALTNGVEPEDFASWHNRIRAEVANAVPGVLYLVAAGVMAKIYCDLIKRAGGVAIDVGSVADIWMRAPTRSFWKQAEGHRL